MDEQMKPGAYTALGVVNIRAAMNTMIDANIVGKFSQGEPFTVLEVYPENGGILWGRVSSNVGGGSSRYVALRVNNHPKAHMERAADEVPDQTSQFEQWMLALDSWARIQGFKGPKPF
jgi:hypothetical protein